MYRNRVSSSQKESKKECRLMTPRTPQHVGTRQDVGKLVGIEETGSEAGDEMDSKQLCSSQTTSHSRADHRVALHKYDHHR